jgi:hypothetical protein
MIRLRGVVVMTGLLAGCGSSGDDGSGQCAQRVGTYVAQYTQLSGTCGPRSDNVKTSTEQPGAPEPPCSGYLRYSQDNCQVQYAADCPTSTGGTVHQEGVANWNRNGSRGTATEEFQVFDADGGTVCTGTYDVTMARR